LADYAHPVDVCFVQVDLPPAVAVALQTLAGLSEVELQQLGNVEGVTDVLKQQPFLALAFVRLVQCVCVEMLHIFALLTFPCSPLRLWLPTAVQLMDKVQLAEERKVRMTAYCTPVLLLCFHGAAGLIAEYRRGCDGCMGGW
jgi:hypothetical protein